MENYEKDYNLENKNKNPRKKGLFQLPFSLFKHKGTSLKSSKYDNIPFSGVEYKKVIVYISGEDNINFVNQFSVEERNKMFNEFLELAQEKTNAEMKAHFVKSFLIQLSIVLLTLAIFLPLFMVGFNKSYDLTLESYKTSIQNFEKLYKKKQYKNKQTSNDIKKYSNNDRK